jgi:hypothetical protein
MNAKIVRYGSIILFVVCMYVCMYVLSKLHIHTSTALLVLSRSQLEYFPPFKIRYLMHYLVRLREKWIL